MAAEVERCLAFCCYSVCLIIVIAVPYHSCDEFGLKSDYTMNYKTWSVVFLIICMLHLWKDCCFDMFNSWHMHDRISLQTRNRLR